MDAADLLALLQSRGITLAVDHGNITVDHKGELTDTDRDGIRAHKPALLRLLSESGPAPPEAPAPPPWPRRPAELAEWPVEWRRRWGRLANELQDQGIRWPECEQVAFEQTRVGMVAGTSTGD
jgi:hypothetical protein